MVIKSEKAEKIVSEKPRGGKGIIINNRYLDSHELDNNLQGFYVNELEPSGEIGYHMHEGEEEIYYVLEGNGIILDNGKEIASGTKEELKNMISIGEKITVEVYGISDVQLNTLQSMDSISTVDFDGTSLTIRSKQNKNNLEKILEFIKSENINFGKIYTELPTLNDVFLEITGKELRD